MAANDARLSPITGARATALQIDGTSHATTAARGQSAEVDVDLRNVG